MASSSDHVKEVDIKKESEYLCETCKKKGNLTVNATVYCRTCALCYCNNCYVCGHDVLCSSNKQLWTKGTKPRDHQLCVRHPGELVKLYCRRHGQICCEICLSTVHRFCVEMTELKGIKDVIASKQAVDKVTTGLGELQTKIEVLQTDRVTRTNTIETSFNKSLDRVGQFRRKANAAFDDIETNLSKYRRTYLDRYAGDQAINRNMLQMVTAYKTEIENSDGQNTIFDVKSCNDWMVQSLATLTSMNNTEIRDCLVPIHDNNVTKVVQDIATFGEVNLSYDFQGISIRVEGDEVECMVGGICQMPDGSFILTDTANKKLKKLDRSYQIVEHYQMDAEPRSVCCVNEKEVAVAMSNNTIKLVSVGDKMNILQSFNCKYDVIGVAATCQKLYTVALGMKSCTLSAVYNDVYFIIYNRIGDKVKLFNNTDSKFRSRNMTATTDGSRFYLACDDEIVTTNIQGQTLSTKKIENGSGVCVDESGYVYVSESGKNQILKLNKNWELVSVVVKDTDGFTDPGVLCFDKNARRLIVAKKEGDFIYLV